jgi:hypothetical protein
MIKKLSFLLALAAVMASAVPAFANAATGLTEKGGLVTAGSKIAGTTIGNLVITSTKTGNITCPSITVTDEVSANSAATVALRGVVKAIKAPCTLGAGNATATEVTLVSLHTTGGGTAAVNMSLTIDLPGGTDCTYSTPAGTATYNPGETGEGGDIITLSEVPLNVTPAACGTTAKLDWKFSIETDETTTPVFLM